MVSTIGVAKNDNSEVCHNIFQTGHLMSRNLVKQKFHSKDSMIGTTRPAENGEKRPVTVFWKLAIFWATMGFVANFTVRAPKCRPDDQQQKTS